MLVFLSWSGSTSQAVASALRTWLPNVLQALKPWMSGADIASGTRWSSEIADKLGKSATGIVCVTRQNQLAPWLNFEAGAIAKSVTEGRACTYLFDLAPTDLRNPLAQFQSRPADEAGTRELVRDLNALLPAEQRVVDVDRAFGRWWPDLNEALAFARSSTDAVAPPVRSDRELIEEILEVVRKMLQREDARVREEIFRRGLALALQNMKLPRQLHRVDERLGGSFVEMVTEALKTSPSGSDPTLGEAMDRLGLRLADSEPRAEPGPNS